MRHDMVNLCRCHGQSMREADHAEGIGVEMHDTDLAPDSTVHGLMGMSFEGSGFGMNGAITPNG